MATVASLMSRQCRQTILHSAIKSDDVLLTRHRQACILIGRASDRELLDAIPPASPAYIGFSPDPLYQGWETHEAVFAAMASHRLA